MDVLVKFGVSVFNRSRDIRTTQFMMDNEDDERIMANGLQLMGLAKTPRHLTLKPVSLLVISRQTVTVF